MRRRSVESETTAGFLIAIGIASLMAGCDPDTVEPAEAPPRPPITVHEDRAEPADVPLYPAGRADLQERIGRSYQANSEPPTSIAVVFSGAPLRLPPTWTIDIQTGNGHGGGLRFLRFESAGAEVQVEEVVWQAYSIGREEQPSGRARRTRMSGAECSPLIEAVCLLPTVELVESGGPALDDLMVRGHWFSTNDFFVLVRVLDPYRQPVLERTFCGYESEMEQLSYLAPQAVCRVAREALPESARWADVSPDQLRDTHFVSAFVQNREVMVREFSWWVRGYSIEALGHFGGPEAVPVLESLRSREGSGRRFRKIDEILKAPEHWLAGPPKWLRE